MKAEGDKYQVTGDLTLHGVTKEITLTLNKVAEKDTGKMGYRSGWTTETKLKRSDYGMTNWESLVGDDIELRIEAELFRSDGEPQSGKPAEPTEPPASDND